ncbi:hypothetical protein V8C42DRAFT_361744 [Trichoderma barbatum]
MMPIKPVQRILELSTYVKPKRPYVRRQTETLTEEQVVELAQWITAEHAAGSPKTLSQIWKHACETYNISYLSTTYRESFFQSRPEVRGYVQHQDRILTAQRESELLEWIKAQNIAGSPKTCDEVLKNIHKTFNFQKEPPQRQWLVRFLNRLPESENFTLGKTIKTACGSATDDDFCESLERSSHTEETPHSQESCPSTPSKTIKQSKLFSYPQLNADTNINLGDCEDADINTDPGNWDNTAVTTGPRQYRELATDNNTQMSLGRTCMGYTEDTSHQQGSDCLQGTHHHEINHQLHDITYNQKAHQLFSQSAAVQHQLS